jgi:hypothetical protein
MSTGSAARGETGRSPAEIREAMSNSDQRVRPKIGVAVVIRGRKNVPMPKMATARTASRSLALSSSLIEGFRGLTEAVPRHFLTDELHIQFATHSPSTEVCRRFPDCGGRYLRSSVTPLFVPRISSRDDSALSLRSISVCEALRLLACPCPRQCS